MSDHLRYQMIEWDDLSLDHIIPVSRNGRDREENLRTLCRPCNSKKGNRHG